MSKDAERVWRLKYRPQLNLNFGAVRCKENWPLPGPRPALPARFIRFRTKNDETPGVTPENQADLKRTCSTKGCQDVTARLCKINAAQMM